MQNQENNVFSRSSLQCLCGNLCNWAYDIRLYIASTNKPKSAQIAKKFFLYVHIILYVYTCICILYIFIIYVYIYIYLDMIINYILYMKIKYMLYIILYIIV